MPHLPDFLNCGAVVSLPSHRLLVGWGKREFHIDQPAFYISDFFLKTSQPWRQYTHWMDISHEELSQLLVPASPLPTCDWAIDRVEEFTEAFYHLSNDLHTNQLQKAVPYLFAVSSSVMTPQRLQSCLKQALISLEQKAGYLYGHWDANCGVLGVTPELLFSHSGHEPQSLHTMALAGTCHSSDHHEALTKNEKEQHEHQFVVQGIYHSLQALGSVTVGKPQLLQLPRLTHLMTPIEVKLHQPFCFEQCVRSLHPTPALGAFPPLEGKKWLANYEHHTPRYYYGAPIGFKYPALGLSQCLIGIRGVQWNHLGMRIGAGAGVVKQSQFDKEWLEIQLKIRAIRGLLNL